MLKPRSEVTQILAAVERGDPHAAEQLLPIVYDQLRKLAARLADERPGQTLQATALVHETFLRLVGDQTFENRGHFFAAAETMLSLTHPVRSWQQFSGTCRSVVSMGCACQKEMAVGVLLRLRQAKAPGPKPRGCQV